MDQAPDVREWATEHILEGVRQADAGEFAATKKLRPRFLGVETRFAGPADSDIYPCNPRRQKMARQPVTFFVKSSNFV